MGNTEALNRRIYMQMTGGMANQQLHDSLSVPANPLNDNGRVY